MRTLVDLAKEAAAERAGFDLVAYVARRGREAVRSQKGAAEDNRLHPDQVDPNEDLRALGELVALWRAGERASGKPGTEVVFGLPVSTVVVLCELLEDSVWNYCLLDEGDLEAEDWGEEQREFIRERRWMAREVATALVTFRARFEQMAKGGRA